MSSKFSRFRAKHTVEENGCWLWTGGKKGGRDKEKVYGSFWCNGKSELAHRASYSMYIDEIPEGMCIDHLCRTPLCVNPHHLEPVTSRENTIRGMRPQLFKEWHLAKTHCPKEHPYSGENLYVNPRGARECRTCRKGRDSRRYKGIKK